MKNRNIYEATFWDYYDFEMFALTKKFDNFTEAKNYSIEKLNNNAIPYFRLYRNGKQIALSNGKTTNKNDSRQ